MKLTLQKPDNIGALASVLCMIHCFATPILFITQAHSIASYNVAPMWWKLMDYLFLTISFFAIYHSTKTTSSNWMKKALWLSWLALFVVIINEKVGFFHLPEYVTYIIASLLAVLHLYNRRYYYKIDKRCVN